MKWVCQNCKSINAELAFECHKCYSIPTLAQQHVLGYTATDEVQSDRLGSFLAILKANGGKFPQSQESTQDQLNQLATVANLLGLYDAADFVMKWLRK